MSKKVVVFPGSFDPFTNGHYDIAKRALKTFDELIISVVDNPSKKSLFSLDERCHIIEKVFEDSNQKVRVMTFSGLLVNHLKDVGTKVILRGLRAISDFDYEAQMALVNMHLGGDVETLFMMAREENSYISSTLIKQIVPYGGDVSRLVPKAVLKALLLKFNPNS